MILGIINLTIAMLANFSTINSSDTHFRNSDLQENDKTITLHAVDLIYYPEVVAIIDDIMSERDSVDRNNAKYYLIKLTKHGDGYFAYITESTLDYLPNIDNYIGYAFWGDYNDLIIMAGDEDKSKKLKNKNTTKTFNLDKGIPIIYDPRTWNFFISQNVYARYIWGIGWFWHIPPEYEIKPKNKSIVTFPKRNKK